MNVFLNSYRMVTGIVSCVNKIRWNDPMLPANVLCASKPRGRSNLRGGLAAYLPGIQFENRFLVD